MAYNALGNLSILRFRGWMRFDHLDGDVNGHLKSAFTICYRFKDKNDDVWTDRCNQFKYKHTSALSAAMNVMKTAVPVLVKALQIDSSKTVFIPAISSSETVASPNGSLSKLTQACAQETKATFRWDVICKNPHRPLHSLRTKQERLAELAKANYRAETLSAQHVVIFDDIITRGDTLSRIAQAIRSKNPEILVYGVALGRSESNSYRTSQNLPELSNSGISKWWNRLWKMGATYRQGYNVMEVSPTAVALLTLRKFKGVGSKTARKVLDEFPDVISLDTYRETFFSFVSDYLTSRLSADALVTNWDRSIDEINASHDAGIQVVSIYDENYPKRLRQISDPPPVLFVKGNIDPLHAPRSLAIIGTRQPTGYGKEVARRLARTAVGKGFVIVSGLAHGCDTYAHEGCLDVSGIGVVVLAHGLDRVHPAANRDLADRLLERGGCLVSEYPIGQKPFRSAFVARDRIQSGLADAVIVVETDVRGGTMHTVRYACEQQRPLACIEHPERLRVEAKTRGNQQLIDDKKAEPIPDGTKFVQFLDGLTLSEKIEAPIQLPLQIRRSKSSMVIFDFDLTLVNTQPTEDLRKARQWRQVMAQVPHLEVYSGVNELLRDLSSRGQKLAIVTKSPDMVPKAFIDHYGWPIKIVIGYFQVKNHKPAPDALLLALHKAQAAPESSFHIGDRPEDTAASRAANVTAIGAGWGLTNTQSLEESRPDHLFESVSDLRTFLLSALD